MRKEALLLSLSVFLFVSAVGAFPLDMTSAFWEKGTLPAGYYVNLVPISTPYGDGVSVDTIGYPGAFEYGYDFFAYYSEVLIVPPTGTLLVSGCFRYDDVTPHLDRKYLALYLLRPDLSGLIASVTKILDYAQGHDPGFWYYRSLVISGLPAGQKFRIAFGRGDLCDMDRSLKASWAAVDVVSSRILEVPSRYSTISQAIAAASAGDVIQVASGTYHEHVVVDKDDLEVIGQGSGTTIIDAGFEPTGAGVTITGRNAFLSGFTVRDCVLGEGIRIEGEGAIVMESDVANNSVGICLHADGCKITRTDVHNNTQGIWLQNVTQNCLLYFNSFYDNTQHVYCELPGQGFNAWDNGYAGNYWSGMTLVDANKDGIADDPYVINSDNVDRYPLMGLFLAGDVNHDAKVDIQDLSRVSGAFGSYPGHTKWNPHADVNEDLKVDITDVARTSANFGLYRQ